jgi:Tat protein secretion system quality control protein TatD with DNase activity
VLIDTHAHLDRCGDLLPEAHEQIDRHVIVTVAVSMDVESYRATKALAEQSALIHSAFGVHPWEAPRCVDCLGDLDAHLRETPLIGEAGPDFHFVQDERPYDGQRRVFERHGGWAARLAGVAELRRLDADELETRLADNWRRFDLPAADA